MNLKMSLIFIYYLILFVAIIIFIFDEWNFWEMLACILLIQLIADFDNRNDIA